MPRGGFTVIGVSGCIMMQPLNYGIQEMKPEERRTEDEECRNAKEEEILPDVKEDTHTINHEYGEPPKIKDNKDPIQNPQHDEQFTLSQKPQLS